LIDQSSTVLFILFTDYVEKTEIEKNKEKLWSGLDCIKRNDVACVSHDQIMTHGYAVCHNKFMVPFILAMDSRQMRKSNRPLAWAMPMINF